MIDLFVVLLYQRGPLAGEREQAWKALRRAQKCLIGSTQSLLPLTFTPTPKASSIPLPRMAAPPCGRGGCRLAREGVGGHQLTRGQSKGSMRRQLATLHMYWGRGNQTRSLNDRRRKTGSLPSARCTERTRVRRSTTSATYQQSCR